MRLLRSVLLLSLVLVAAACGRKDDLQHRVRNYDVVEEGSASGVTTSLGGEQPGSVPLTATNVDTTTDLTLLPGTGDTAITDMAAPGSLAETLEIDPAAPARRGPPGGSRPSPRSTEPPASRPAREPVTPTETAEPAPAPPVEEPEAPTTTATQPEEPPPPPPTTTSTQPQEPESSESPASRPV